MLYDIFTIQPTATGMQLLPANQLGLFNIRLSPGQAYMISMMHIAQTEDFSIRSWFSKQPAGISIVSGTNQVMPLIRQPSVCILYDPSTPITVPNTVLAIQAEPGNYVLNFLNLANVENIFSFKIEIYTGTCP